MRIPTFIQVEIIPPLHSRDIPKPLRHFTTVFYHEHINTYHICATSWLWVLATFCLETMSAEVGSKRNA